MSGKRLLVLNLAMDAEHHALGHSVALTNALAERAEHVSVITMTAGTMASRRVSSLLTQGLIRNCK